MAGKGNLQGDGKYVLDTNAVLRFLTKDDEKKAKEVEEILETAKEVYISTPTILETVHILKSKRHLYQWTRKKITETLIDFLALPKVICEEYILEAFTEWLFNPKIDDLEDIINCLIARKKEAKLKTYDKKLKKYCGKYAV